MNIIAVGGGAAGFFGAIRAAELAKELQIKTNVHILENSSQVLKKVRISGGGRCNVTHNCFDAKALIQNYPRGTKELISPFQKFQPKDTLDWFKKRGVTIVAEEDGRMFPNTDSSETIIDCFMGEVKRLGIQLHTNCVVQAIEPHHKEKNKYHIKIKDKDGLTADKVLIATGSSPAGYQFAKSLGHTITELAPSLFSFVIKHPLLTDLSGLSFPKTKLKLSIPEKNTFKQDGPTLITHWGLSGPAILKLSAWAAREMMHSDYKAMLHVNWIGVENLDDVVSQLNTLKDKNPKSQMKNTYPTEIPSRFWQSLLNFTEIRQEMLWADLPKKDILKIAALLYACPLEVTGKNRYKDEFVECGGVSLKEIDFKTMQSKISPGIYFAGELLDIDGITGGFNFQSAWTTSWTAANHMLNSSLS